jgi:hypothetical protein
VHFNCHIRLAWHCWLRVIIRWQRAPWIANKSTKVTKDVFQKSNTQDPQDKPVDQAVIASLDTDQESQQALQQVVSRITDKLEEIILVELKEIPTRPIRFTLRFGDIADKSASEEQRRIV